MNKKNRESNTSTKRIETPEEFLARGGKINKIELKLPENEKITPENIFNKEGIGTQEIAPNDLPDTAKIHQEETSNKREVDNRFPKEDEKKLRNELSVINEIRNKFWKRLRKVRNDFLLKYPDKEYRNDETWKEINRLISDMFESTIKEDIRRKRIISPNRSITICPVCEQTIPGFSLKTRRDLNPGGLYGNDRLCKICKIPLTGKQEGYCSEKCRSINKSRRHRAKDPEGKQKSNYKNLQKRFSKKTT